MQILDLTYRSPNQSQDQFESFSNNFELNVKKLAQQNPYLMVTLGNFNTKSCNWFKQDKTTAEGSEIEVTSMQFGFHPIINEPMHTLDNSFSCTDLLFTSQPNLIVELGVHSFLHLNSHHLTIFVKFNVQLFNHLLTFRRFGPVKMPILILLGLLTPILTGKEDLAELLLTKKLKFSGKLL